MTADAIEERMAAARLKQAIDTRLAHPAQTVAYQAAAGEIFVAYAGRLPGELGADLGQKLMARFGPGSVFADTGLPGESMDPIVARLRQSDVLLVVYEDEGSLARRHDHEILVAAEAGIPIIPVLIGDVSIDKTQDAELAPLFSAPATVRLATWQADVDALITRLCAWAGRAWQPLDRVPAPAEKAAHGWFPGVEAAFGRKGQMSAVTAAIAFGVLAFVTAQRSFAYSPSTAISLAMSALLLMLFPMLLIWLVSRLRPDRATEDHGLKIGCVAILSVTALINALVTNEQTSWQFLSLSLILGLPFAGRVAALASEQRRIERTLTDRWPQRLPERIRPVILLQELSRWRHISAELQTAEMFVTPDKLRFKQDELRSAADQLIVVAEKGRRNWLLDDHPLLVIGYVIWIMGIAGLGSGAADSWRVLVLPAMAVVFAVVTMELGYRYQRRVRRAVAVSVLHGLK